VPLLVSAGTPFPSRNLVIFLSFGVILSTLLLQGLSPPLLVRWLKLRDDALDENEEMKGRSAAAQAALRRLDEWAWEPWVLPAWVERIRKKYIARIQRFQARLHHGSDPHYEEYATIHRPGDVQMRGISGLLVVPVTFASPPPQTLAWTAASALA
jgi:CPA1 family monovalent cation:H+ antiporter